jgi:hypothetical protein
MATQPIIEREYSSGNINLKDKLIEWHKPNGDIVSIDLEQVVVIGEYTTDSGPFVDDWFLTFVNKSGEWKEISVYAEGFDELTQYLSTLLGIDFTKWRLANSTNWKSYVRFPIHLEGKELFVLTPPKGYKKATTILQHIKLALGFGVYGKAWNIDLTEEVKMSLPPP